MNLTSLLLTRLIRLMSVTSQHGVINYSGLAFDDSVCGRHIREKNLLPETFWHQMNCWSFHSLEFPSTMDRNKMNDVSLSFDNFFPAAKQFPSGRVSPTFVNASPEKFEVLCDVAEEIVKPNRSEDIDKVYHEHKKPKTQHESNEILLERIASMGGGFRTFPMPSSIQKPMSTKSEKTRIIDDESLEQQIQLLSKSRLGTFPMPRVKDQRVNLEPTSLDSFQHLWENTEKRFRKEILSRRLERGDIPIYWYD